MFRMHIGSVLSGLDMRNVKTDLKFLSLPVFWVENECIWGVKNETFFSMFGGLGGDFYQDTYEPKLFGVHI